MRAAAQAREAPFVQACLRLADWVGDRKQVTATGVLRLAEAKRAYAELELWRWQEEVVGQRLGAPAERVRQFPWRSAGDALPLERLWFASQEAGLVETLATVARSSAVQPQDDYAWIGLSASLHPGALADRGVGLRPVARAGARGARWLRADGLHHPEPGAEQWEDHPRNVWRREFGDGDYAKDAQTFSDRDLDLSLHFFADTGIWELDGETYRLTDLGREFATVLFSYLEEQHG